MGEDYLWILGVSISAVGSFLATAGLGLQKMTHMRRAESKKLTGIEDKTSYMTKPLWLLGMSLIVLDSILDLVTFGLAPQSLLAPMAALTLVYNTLLAPIFLKETLGKEDLLGTGLIAIGIVMVVWFAEKETPEYSIVEIRKLYQSWNSYIYFTVIISFVVFLWQCTRRITKDTTATLLAMNDTPRFLYPFTYPILAGTFGGQSVLFAKAVVELLKTTMNGSNQFIYPEIYCFLVLMLCSLYFQTNYLNSGLKRFDSLFIIPVYQVAWIISGIAGGGIFYREFASMNFLEIFMFVAGCSVTFLGVRYISMREHNWETDDDDDKSQSLLDVASFDSAGEVGIIPMDIEEPETRQRRGSSIFLAPGESSRAQGHAVHKGSVPIQYALGTTAQALDDLFGVTEAFGEDDDDL